MRSPTKKPIVALAGVAQLAGCHPTELRVIGLIPSGHMLGLWVQSLVRVHARGGRWMFLSHINVSLPVFLPPFPSL